MHPAIYETYAVIVVLHRSMVNWRKQSGVTVPWVYLHSSIYDTYAV